MPAAFQRPVRLQELDAACRMFGFLDGGKLLAGSVGFEDGVCSAPTKHDAIYTCVLSSPKPRHAVWYLDDQQRLVRGRKFYFHATGLQTATNWLPRKDVLPHQRQNAYIKPVGAGSVFTFHAHFTNVAEDDFALLLYALVLEPGMRHKLGYAKPAGLGSVEVGLNWVETVDYVARYRSGGGGLVRCEGVELATFVQQRIQRYTTDTHSLTLRDLRRIWQWPAVYELRYPSQQWFQENPTTPISGTP